ncbi:restriction endonuclease subunit S [Bacteroides fragilis]|jgi:type I restriction enzyme S subunit|uniref:restriction endonuclease subunit S n=1 Tax=Bacteroides fragilis TaxID=817 RepID=UPI0024585242|nr:restriction endonuclease subunit S [Bacteroides fragilis]
MTKRYEKYKDSGIAWIGEIPEHWEVIKMRFLCSFKTGDKDTINKEDDGKYPFYVRSPKIERINTFTYDGEAVLMAGDGVGAGKVIHYVNGKFDYHQRVYNFHKIKKVQPYLLYLFLQSFFSYKIEEGGAKNTVDSVRLPMIKDFPIVIPTSIEQEQIAKYLDWKCGEVDRIVEVRERQLKLLVELRTSVISRAVTHGLNPNTPLKNSGIDWIGQIPEHWEVRRIKSFCIVKRGASPRPIDDEKYFDDNGEFAWVRIADASASEKYLLSTTQKLSSLGASLSVKRFPDDIFLSIAGTVGKAIITKIKCCIHDGFVWFKNLNYNSELLYYIFESGQPYLGLGKMGTQLNLNTDTVGNIPIPYMSNDEQQQIADYLDKKTAEIDSTINKCKVQIDKLKEYRQALITEVVTGKIDVRGIEIPTPKSN